MTTKDVSTIRPLHIFATYPPLPGGYSVRSRYLIEGSLSRKWAAQFRTLPEWLEQLTPSCREEHSRLPGGEQNLAWLKAAREDRRRSEPWLGLPGLGHRLLRWRQSRSLLKSLASPLPTTIHSHSPFYCARWAERLSHRLRLPWLYELRGLWEESAVAEGELSPSDPVYRNRQRAERRAARRAGQVVVICENLRDEVLSWGVSPSRITVCPNGIDPKRFALLEGPNPLRNRPEYHGKFILGYIGSLRKLEGLELALETLAAIREQHQATLLVVVGGGPAGKDLEEQAKRLGLQKHVRFLGPISHEEVKLYYDLIDLFLLPRRRSKVTECVTPLKPLEAMAMGCCVLASDVGGLRELVREGETGFLFEPDNPNALLRRCMELIENPRRREETGRRARAWVLCERTWSRVLDRYEHLYLKLGMRTAS